MIITSKQNPLIKQFAALSEKKFRKELGLYLVEGAKPVSECINAGGAVSNIIATEENASAYPSCTVVSKELFKSISAEKTPQGVIAAVKLPENKLTPPRDCCLLLDCLQDPGNLGTIIRTSNAVGIKEIYLINCVDPFSPKAVRASMSGIFFVNIRQGTRDEVLEVLSEIPLICADMDGKDVFSFNAPEKFCVCIGNEGNGISKQIKDKATYSVKIPMRETCESLNAAVSAGIVMYALKNKLIRG